MKAFTVAPLMIAALGLTLPAPLASAQDVAVTSGPTRRGVARSAGDALRLDRLEGVDSGWRSHPFSDRLVIQPRDGVRLPARRGRHERAQHKRESRVRPAAHRTSHPISRDWVGARSSTGVPVVSRNSFGDRDRAQGRAQDERRRRPPRSGRCRSGACAPTRGGSSHSAETRQSTGACRKAYRST